MSSAIVFAQDREHGAGIGLGVADGRRLTHALGLLEEIGVHQADRVGHPGVIDDRRRFPIDVFRSEGLGVAKRAECRLARKLCFFAAPLWCGGRVHLLKNRDRTSLPKDAV